MAIIFHVDGFLSNPLSRGSHLSLEFYLGLMYASASTTRKQYWQRGRQRSKSHFDASRDESIFNFAVRQISRGVRPSEHSLESLRSVSSERHADSPVKLLPASDRMPTDSDGRSFLHFTDGQSTSQSIETLQNCRLQSATPTTAVSFGPIGPKSDWPRPNDSISFISSPGGFLTDNRIHSETVSSFRCQTHQTDNSITAGR